MMNTIPEVALKRIVNEIIYRIDVKESTISNREILSICKTSLDLFNAETDPHIYHEVAETALNLLIKEKYAKEFLNSSKPYEDFLLILKPLSQRLPTQTWRSKNQIIRQQFSTPPQIAWFLSYLLNFQKNEIVLEPSAGTGSLAVWASGFGLRIITNEIEARRRALLDFLGLKSTSFNAEYIHDYLPTQIKPDVLIMNPPFSSNGGRTKNNSSKYGFRHVRSALERLNPGGKFGIILGSFSGLDTWTGRKFWQGLSEEIDLKAIIKIDGREYAKYGTRVDINLIIGTKRQKSQANTKKAALDEIVNLSIGSIEEGFIKAQSKNLRLG
jgi:type I restriction-modification system DNA methylase subunit